MTTEDGSTYRPEIQPGEGTAAAPSFNPPPGFSFPEGTSEAGPVPTPVVPQEPPTRVITFPADTAAAPTPAPAPQPSQPVTEPGQEAPAPETNNDIDSIVPETPEVILTDGTTIRVNRLKTRELFKLLKILTRGGAGMLSSISFDQEDQEAFVGQIMAVIMIAVPEAEDEAMEFVQAMASPLGLIERPRSKADRDYNTALQEELDVRLENPEIEDTVSIILKIIQQEGKDIQALGKRLAALLPAAIRL